MGTPTARADDIVRLSPHRVAVVPSDVQNDVGSPHVGPGRLAGGCVRSAAGYPRRRRVCAVVG